MNAGSPGAQINGQILEEACGWFMDCNEGELDEASRERFNQWLRRSPEHVRAFLEISSTWEESSGLFGARTPTATSLIAAAAIESNVIALHARPDDTGTPDTVKTHSRGARPWRWFAAVAATVIAAAIVLALSPSFTSRYKLYSTGIGEQRPIILDDGSTVVLDTKSQLRVQFSPAERLVELVDGQALFDVRHDAARPFTVLSGETRVRAVGTRFDVYRKGPDIAITVVEGRVAVTAAPSTRPVAGTTLQLSAGEQLTVTPHNAPHPIKTDVESATSWTQHKLIFDQVTVKDVVAEFNRYNSRQIVIDDPSLGGYHIRGGFATNDPQQLLQFLRDRFDADVHEQANEIRVSRK